MSKQLQILVCRTTFVVGRRFVRKGETLPSDHELVRGNEKYFRPYEGDATETASAAPGEKRNAKFEKTSEEPAQAPADEGASDAAEVAEAEAAATTADDDVVDVEAAPVEETDPAANEAEAEE